MIALVPQPSDQIDHIVDDQDNVDTEGEAVSSNDDTSWFENLKKFFSGDYRGPNYDSNSSGSAFDYNAFSDNLFSYLDGMLSSVGSENDLNRKYNSAEAQLQRDWQSAENEKNRFWQTEMANSAYQRAAADMKAAGLNPVLAATGGATSTPTGVIGAGSSASYNVGGGDTFSTVVNAAAGLVSAISKFLPANQVVEAVREIGFRA